MQYAARITLSANSPEPAFTGGPFVSGVAKLDTAKPATTGWDNTFLKSCAEFGERVDIVTGGNYGQLLDTIVEISNHGKWYAAFQAAGASLIGAKVEIGQAVDSSTITARWTGIVADAIFQGVNIECRVENILVSRHKEIPSRILTRAEFDSMQPNSEGSAVPIIYGAIDRLAPTALQSNNDYRVAFTARSTKLTVSKPRYNTYIPYGAGIPAPSTIQIPIVVAVSPFGEPDHSADNLWYSDIMQGDLLPYYVEIVSGTGSGQTRLIDSIVSSGTYTAMSAAEIFYANVSLSAPFDTTPDHTSSIKIYRTQNFGILALADVCVLGNVLSDKDGAEYPIAASQEVQNGIQTANIAAEFKSGNNYAAISYFKPSLVYDSVLSDGFSKSFGTTLTVMPIYTEGPTKYADFICWGRFDMFNVPTDTLRMSPKVYILVSASAAPANARLFLSVHGTRFDGTDDMIIAAEELPGESNSVNGFSPAMAVDGEAGNFSAFSIAVTSFPVTLEAYESIRFGVIASSSQPTTVNVYGDAQITKGGNTVALKTTESTPPPTVGDFIRVDDASSTSDQYAYDYREKVLMSGYNRYANPSSWREISSVTYIAAGMYSIGIVGNWAEESGEYKFITINPSEFISTTQTECGIVFSAGDVDVTSKFLANISSGRTFSSSWPVLPSGASIGGAITLARDAVLDMYYRDLGLGADAVDFDAFQDLPAVEIHSALVERVNSADRVAELCQQFNWVVSHDSSGRETAIAWMARVGSTDYDYSIDTGDIAEGSLTGVSVSDVLDLCNLPNIKWNWTQADGYRSESNVVDVTIDPLSLNASNYLQYITGFRDFSTALEVYTQLHGSWSLNNRQNSESFEMPDVGSDASSVLWPTVGMDRFTWMSSRKPIYQMSVPDTSSAWLATVGKRVRLRHKRYTGGTWVYGTVVEWSYDPEAAECRITVMGDPSEIAPAYILMVDTIDPSGTVPQYIDMADGISEQYTDSIAGAP